MYVRTKQIPPDEGNWYRYLVKGQREGDDVKQKVIKYLGPAKGPDDHSIHEDDDLDDLPDDIEDKLGTTKSKGKTESNEVYNEEYKGEMSEFIGENRNAILEGEYDPDEYTKEEAREEMKKALEREGKSADKIYVDEEENKVYALSSPYDIDTYPEGVPALATDSKSFNKTLAQEIYSTDDNKIHFKNSMGEDQLIVKGESDNEWGYQTKKYKVYNYSDGDYIFIDDEKTPIEEV